jgi:hypothetical protein
MYSIGGGSSQGLIPVGEAMGQGAVRHRHAPNNRKLLNENGQLPYKPFSVS